MWQVVPNILNILKLCSFVKIKTKKHPLVYLLRSFPQCSARISREIWQSVAIEQDVTYINVLIINYINVFNNINVFNYTLSNEHGEINWP